MKIKDVTINSKLCLAPMAGVTDWPSAPSAGSWAPGTPLPRWSAPRPLCYQDKKSIPLLRLGESEHPCAAQIFGSDEKCMEEAAAIAGEVSGADIIDVNMGCPVPKVAQSGDGSGLMRGCGQHAI